MTYPDTHANTLILAGSNL